MWKEENNELVRKFEFKNLPETTQPIDSDGKSEFITVTGFPNNGIRVSDSITNLNMLNNELILKSSIVYSNVRDWKNCGSFIPVNETSNSDVNPGVLNGYIGTTTTNAFDPTTLGSWFSSGTFVGAVESSNDWTAGWTK